MPYRVRAAECTWSTCSRVMSCAWSASCGSTWRPGAPAQLDLIEAADDAQDGAVAAAAAPVPKPPDPRRSAPAAPGLPAKPTLRRAVSRSRERSGIPAPRTGAAR